MQEKAVILIVDDVPSNIQILAAVLKDDYKLKVTTCGQEALKLAIQEPLADLILLDVEMPQMNGYDVMKKLKKMEVTENIPVIFVTAKDQIDDEERGLELGAVDYITKPIRPAIVKARVKTHITIKQQRDILIFTAVHDQLTGLYNRHHLMDEGGRKFSRAKRQENNLSAVMIDLDNFKKINDTYGHQVGDNVLREIASLLNNADKRNEDITARYGGEEFILLLEDCDSNTAKEKAESIRKEIQRLNVDTVNITGSFGVAQLNQTHESIEDLFKDADTALYKAKETGRNRVVVYDFKE